MVEEKFASNEQDSRAGSAQSRQGMVSSFRFMRIFVGFSGLLLPFFLLIGGEVFDLKHNPDSSISAYYFSPMREIFVGTLFVVGGFLFCYRGRYNSKHDFPPDNWILNAAGVFLIIVAVFPTNLDCNDPKDQCTAIFSHEPDISDTADTSMRLEQLFDVPQLIGGIHFVSAALFFILMAFMSIRRFTRWPPHWERTREALRIKFWRNLIYLTCGWGMLIFIALVPATSDSLLGKFLGDGTVFWLEAFAMWAFAIVWLVSGQIVPWISSDERS